MSDYEEDQFERLDSNSSEKKHLLKLSIDLLSVKDLKTSANISVSYNLKLT
jgi:hypothetical protein